MWPKYSPRRTNAVAGHLAVVAKQLVISLDDAPGSDADADHSSCPLLTLEEQSVAHLLGDSCGAQKYHGMRTMTANVERVGK